jgi:3-hydroxyacyl-[acyl-carrier-protein] dehydratase/UDP-3-O-[3-hydroxymyristoyl] N-acetylglucosamine deacetylase/3-hydroxyacyl-[acyl-carrier-protein] dehydratase
MANMLNIEEIMGILPHRFPFLLVDKIVELEEKKRIVGIKNVTYNENFFQGHFPSKPVMPGVLIIEAMAQVGGVLLLKSLPEMKRRVVFFMGIDKAKFRRPVYPGDQIRIEVEVLRLRERTCKVQGKAFVDGDLVAEAEIMSALSGD